MNFKQYDIHDNCIYTRNKDCPKQIYHYCCSFQHSDTCTNYASYLHQLILFPVWVLLVYTVMLKPIKTFVLHNVFQTYSVLLRKQTLMTYSSCTMDVAISSTYHRGYRKTHLTRGTSWRWWRHSTRVRCSRGGWCCGSLVYSALLLLHQFSEI